VKEKGRKGFSSRPKTTAPLVSGSELKKLVSKAKRGDVEAFQQLYELYSRKILNYIYRLTGSRAETEDLTQDTFVRIFHPPGYRGSFHHRNTRTHRGSFFPSHSSYNFSQYSRNKQPCALGGQTVKSIDPSTEDTRGVVS
jgi:hypothetical protein